MRLDIRTILLASVLASPAAAQVPAAVPDTKPGPAAAGPAQTFTETEIEALLGSMAVSSDGRSVGEVGNLLIYPDGEVAAIVLEWGSLLGLGEKRAVVPWDEVTLAPARDAVFVDLTREELESLPRYDPDVPVASGVDPDVKPVR